MYNDWLFSLSAANVHDVWLICHCADQAIVFIRDVVLSAHTLVQIFGTHTTTRMLCTRTRQMTSKVPDADISALIFFKCNDMQTTQPKILFCEFRLIKNYS